MSGSGAPLARRRRRGVDRSTWRSARALLPQSGDIDEFVSVVASRRGRRIRILEHELTADAPSGLWLATTDTDYIVHGAGLTAEYRRTVVCHEIAHMLLDHPAREGALDTTLIAPTVDPVVAARFFTRHGYADELETEAEALGTLLASELGVRVDTSRTQAVRARDTISSRLR